MTMRRHWNLSSFCNMKGNQVSPEFEDIISQQLILATSEFEKQLLEGLCTMISKSDEILLTEKLMIILACSTFDDFDNAIDSFEKVNQSN